MGFSVGLCRFNDSGIHLRKTNYYLLLTVNEYCSMLRRLCNLSNKLIADDGDTNAADEIIIKCIK